MARNEIDIDAPREQVYGLLKDPRTYGIWVVGSRKIRAADPDWPAPGTAFDHRVGVGPLIIHDHTDVVAAREPEELELIARAAPLPPARIHLQLIDRDGATHLVMEEEPLNPLLSRLLTPVGHRLLWLRNVEALRRLKALAEGRAPLPTGELPPREAIRG
jgi:uncharacterized protein YndB with AHSA1/START domain